MSTDAPASSVGADSAGESTLAEASPLPKIEIKLPGATGDCGINAAELITALGGKNDRIERQSAGHGRCAASLAILKLGPGRDGQLRTGCKDFQLPLHAPA
jgi:hypothetical protein